MDVLRERIYGQTIECTCGRTHHIELQQVIYCMRFALASPLLT